MISKDTQEVQVTTTKKGRNGIKFFKEGVDGGGVHTSNRR